MNISKSLPIFFFLFLFLVACGPEEPGPVVPGLESPRVTSVTPENGAADVPVETAVVAMVSLPNDASIDNATLDGGVRLTSEAGMNVPGTASVSGNSLTFSPADELAAATRYTFAVTSALKDERGAAFEPFTVSFTTTVEDTPGNGEIPTGEVTVEPASQELIFSAVQGKNSLEQLVTVKNTGDGSLTFTEAQLAGANAQDFALDPPPVPVTLAPGAQTQFGLTFSPRENVTGSLSAALMLTLEDADEGVQVGLYGLSSQGLGGNNEPPLQAVVDTLGYAIDVGGDELVLGTDPAPIGDEVPASLFRKVGAGPVTITPVARYSPAEMLPFGYYTLQTDAPVPHQVGVLSREASESQTLNPGLAEGAESFEPETEPFGFYVDSQFFKRVSYTQDKFNKADGQVAHAARVYPLKDREGQSLANAYLVAFEDASNGDYQDYVFVVTNVEPAQ